MAIGKDNRAWCEQVRMRDTANEFSIRNQPKESRTSHYNGMFPPQSNVLLLAVRLLNNGSHRFGLGYVFPPNDKEERCGNSLAATASCHDATSSQKVQEKLHTDV